MKKIYVIIGFIAALVILAIAVPFIREYKVYKQVKNAHDVYSCDCYIDEYPKGRYVDDVRYIKIKSLQEESYPVAKGVMSAITEYINEFPNGRHSEEVEALCDDIWDNEIQRYHQRDKTHESSEAVKYMTEMLQYMKKNRINSVNVEVTSHLKLKDYEEYDSNVREFLEAFNDSHLPLASGMISLKSNFSEADVSSLKEILSDGVQKSFNKMFTPDFISVENSSSKDIPVIHFDYTIQSQEDNFGSITLPHIWTYNEGNVVKNYMIGISVFFNATCSIPESRTTFKYSEKGEPAENIDNIDNINDGYRKMTLISFAEFSNKMAKNMGLKEIYFQGEE